MVTRKGKGPKDSNFFRLHALLRQLPVHNQRKRGYTEEKKQNQAKSPPGAAGEMEKKKALRERRLWKKETKPIFDEQRKHQNFIEKKRAPGVRKQRKR